MSSLFQIVFKGELLDGFDEHTVRASAHKRLKAAPEQIDRIFSGKRAVLKKGLAEDAAQRYLTELQRIGMRVSVEAEAIDTQGAMSAPPAKVVTQSSTSGAAPQRMMSRDTPQFDPLKTQLAFPPADDIPASTPERWNQPTIAVSQRHLTSMSPSIDVANGDSPADAPLVPPRESIDRTVAGGLQSLSAFEAAEPTLIVPPRQHAGSSDATLIVPPRRSAASDPTLIVPSPSTAASSEPTMIVPPRAIGTPGPVIIRADQKLVRGGALDPSTEEGFDAEKTLVAGDEAIADYLSPAVDEPLQRAPAAPAREAVAEEVVCPTCGERQPPRVHCRRCGNVIAPMPTGTFTAPSLTRPPVPPAAPKPTPAAEETVIYDPQAEALQYEEESAGRSGLLATPSWVLIVVLIALLMIGATWLFI